MKRIIASIICFPVTFFITRLASVLCDMRLAALKAADPEFPHTTLQAVEKCAFESSIMLPVLFSALCFTWVMFSIFRHIDKCAEEAAKRRQEARK